MDNSELKPKTMKKDSISEPGIFVDIRFSRGFSIILFIVAAIMLILYIRGKQQEWYDHLYLISALVLFINGISPYLSRRYVRLDKSNKKVNIYTVFGIVARAYKYDRLFFREMSLYREIGGKTRFINILRSQCVKDDFNNFVKEVNNGV